jgi:putative ABC transport system permease protein
MLGLALRPSINAYIDGIPDSAIANYQYILKAPTPVSDSNAEKFSIRSGEYYDSAIDQSFDVSLIGVIEGSKYLSGAEFSDDSVMASESLRKKYKLHDGDMLEITDTASNKKYNFIVDGFYHYDAGFAVIMPIDQLNLLVNNEKDYFNGLFSNASLDINQDMIATVITPETMRGAGEQMLTAFSFMDAICLIAAVVIHLVLFVLLTKLVLDKNTHNVSLMKIFGYRQKELRGIFLSATTFVVIFSLTLTLLPVWAGIKLLYTEMMMRKMSGYLNIITPWWCFAITLGLGLFCYFAVNILHMRRIKNISMGQALKVME